MPKKGYKALTITEESDEKLGEIKEVLKEKSKSSTANKIIDEKHSSLKKKRER